MKTEIGNEYVIEYTRNQLSILYSEIDERINKIWSILDEHFKEQ